MSEPLTFVLDGKLQVSTVLTAAFVRLIWPSWLEGVHWAEGALTEDSRAGRALLSARILHGQDPESGRMDADVIEVAERTVQAMAGASVFGMLTMGALRAA